METDAPLFSRNNWKVISLLGTVLISGCASSAPPLPVDTTSTNRTEIIGLDSFSRADAALSCDQIAAERQDIDNRIRMDNSQIESNRTQNQVAGYLGALFIVPLAATESNQPERDDITRLYGRRDTLIKLAAVKDCSNGR